MKKSTYSNSLHESMNIMRIVNNFFGLRFLEFPPGHIRICWSVFYIAVLWIAWTYHIYTIKENSPFSAVDIYIILLDISVNVSITFLGCYYSESYAIFNQKLKNADERVQKLGVPHNRREIYNTYIIFVMWLLPSLFAIGYEFQWFLLNKNLTFYSALYTTCFGAYALLLTSFVFLDFAICIRNVKNGFEKVNYLLEGLIEDYGLNAEVFRREMPIRTDAWAQSENLVNSGSHFPTSVRSEEVLERDDKIKSLLHLTRLIHLELTAASKILYMMFNMQLIILLQLGLMYIAECIIMFYGYSLEVIEVYSNLFRSVVMEVFNVFVYFTKIVLICYFSENAMQEGQKMMELIHTCSNAEGIDSETMDEIQQFSLQITQMNYGSTRINSYFQMDYNFLSEYILSIITYVLIMIEISDFL